MVGKVPRPLDAPEQVLERHEVEERLGDVAQVPEQVEVAVPVEPVQEGLQQGVLQGVRLQ